MSFPDWLIWCLELVWFCFVLALHIVAVLLPMCVRALNDYDSF